MMQKTILIAGGTGLIGQELLKTLEDEGYIVRILTRKQNLSLPYYHWNPEEKVINKEALENVNVIINLCGSPIAGKRWTPKYKAEILDSRIKTAQFLLEQKDEIPQLSHYITASGITCYGYEDNEKLYRETDGFGTDFLSNVVQQWESTADSFSPFCKVTKIRTGVVLTEKGGALPLLSKTVKYNIGSPMGTGGQIMPWISLKDIARVYSFIIKNELDGSFNAASGNISNAQLINKLAKKLEKPLWLPKVPSAVLKIMMGEMSSAILKGVHIDNQKLLDAGFNFEHPTIESLLTFIYDKKETER